MQKAKSEKIVGFALKAVPVVIMLCAILFIGLQLRDASFEEIINATPENPMLAALVIWGVYAVKSLSVLFPLIAIYVAAGILFSTPTAILVNLIGMLICITVPYCIGCFSCGGITERILKRYDVARKIKLWTGKNDVLSAYLLRVVSILPGDVVSLFLGASRMRFGRYVLGSILGLSPVMLIATVLGEKIGEPASPEFIGLLILLIFVSLGSSLFFNRRGKRD